MGGRDLVTVTAGGWRLTLFPAVKSSTSSSNADGFLSSISRVSGEGVLNPAGASGWTERGSMLGKLLTVIIENLYLETDSTQTRISHAEISMDYFLLISNMGYLNGLVLVIINGIFVKVTVTHMKRGELWKNASHLFASWENDDPF